MKGRTQLIVGGLALVAVLCGGAGLVVAAAVVGVSYLGHQAAQRAKVEHTRAVLAQANERLLIWMLQHGEPPGQREGLQVAYAEEPVPNDAWGHEIVYLIPGPDGAPFDLLSFGSDGAAGGTGTAADLRLSEGL